METAIETQGLTKDFAGQRAVDGIDLEIGRGSVFGLLGPNGAGKTTTVRMLATLLKPSSGSARVLGFDLATEPAAIRARVSLTGQFASVDDDLTGRENLILLARLQGYRWRDARVRAGELLRTFALLDAAERQVFTYSGGMRRRLDIAASLIVTPAILFLDEPTTGLDPRSRNQVWDMVRAFAERGTTVLLTTQYLEEADQLAHRLAVIDHGRVIAQGTSRELKASVGGGALKLQLKDAAQNDAAIAVLNEVLGTGSPPQATIDGLSVRVNDTAATLRALAALEARRIELEGFTLGTPSLDEVFFALTGKPVQTEAEEPAP